MDEKNDNSLKYMKVRTRGDSNPSGKRRVYFTCHPKDFEFYFDKVCEDIFKTQDCAIYYTEDMSAPIPEQYLESDLGQMSLFVIPVTHRLLSEPNRAMDFDFAFATSERHMIPVLPLMMETEVKGEKIDELYEKKFGKREYCSPYDKDITSIGYEEKLKKYLSSVLLDDDTVERIRKAFDAYIFLSYRKKDRNHANELMGLIHKNPMYRDVAIWYDEFLTPGEDFEKDIKKALDKSELFALLVTPNLVNEQNYVQTTEYPYAHDKAKKLILPAEMVKTDGDELKKQYPGVPNCVNAHTDELDKAVLDGLKTISLRANEDDPEHCFLIGLAYLEGVDVEVNKDYAIELITLAAEKRYPDAMAYLWAMYVGGNFVKYDANKALLWAQKLYDFYLETEGENGENTFFALNNIAVTYNSMGNNRKALEVFKKVSDLAAVIYGKESDKAIESLLTVAYAYAPLFNYDGMHRAAEDAYYLARRVKGEDSTLTLECHNLIATSYVAWENYEEALKVYRDVYKQCCKIFGKRSEQAMNVRGNIAIAYAGLGDMASAIKTENDVCDYVGETNGYDSVNYLRFSKTLAGMYAMKNELDKAIEIDEKVYSVGRERLGESHPFICDLLRDLALLYGKKGDHKKEFTLFWKSMDNTFHFLDKTNPEVVMAFEKTFVPYFKQECGIDNDNINIREILPLIFDFYSSLGICSMEELIKAPDGGFGLIPDNFAMTSEAAKKGYKLMSVIYGEKDDQALNALEMYACALEAEGDYQKSYDVLLKLYNIRCEKGEPKPIYDTLIMLADICDKLGDEEKANEYSDKADELKQDAGLGDEDTPENPEGKAGNFGGDTDGFGGLGGGDTQDPGDGLGGLDGLDGLDDLGDLGGLVGLGGGNGEENAPDIVQAENAYRLMCEIFGEEHESTIKMGCALAFSYKEIGEYAKSAELFEKIYELVKYDDDIAFDILDALKSLYELLGQSEKVADVNERIDYLKDLAEEMNNLFKKYMNEEDDGSSEDAEDEKIFGFSDEDEENSECPDDDEDDNM